MRVEWWPNGCPELERPPERTTRQKIVGWLCFFFLKDPWFNRPVLIVVTECSTGAELKRFAYSGWSAPWAHGRFELMVADADALTVEQFSEAYGIAR